MRKHPLPTISAVILPLVLLLVACSGCGNFIGTTTGSNSSGVGCALQVNGQGDPVAAFGLGWTTPQITNQELGQSFQVDQLSEVSTLDLRMRAIYPTGESFGSSRIRARIFAQSTGGIPAEDQTPLATGQLAISEIATASKAGSSLIRFTLDKPIGLVKGTTYWIVIDGDYLASTTKYVEWSFAATNATAPDAHANGVAFYKNGSSWSQANDLGTGLSRDFAFRVGCQ